MNDKQWFEKENFWLNYGPIMFDAHHWAEAPGIARAICEMCQLPPGSRILDAGCGPGRITVELALQGMDVTGVDIIGPYLEAAQETAADEGVSITTVQADLRSFQPQEKFDAAVNLYTSFGYCDTMEEDTKILKNIADSIRQGGHFVMECLSRENAVRDFTEGYQARIANLGRAPANSSDPESFKTVVSPHLDRYWHEEAYLPAI